MNGSKFVLILVAMIASASSQDDSWKLYDDTEVDEVHISIDSVRLEWIYEHVESDSLHPVTLRYVSGWFDETLDSVGFRLRGNTSRTAAKKSFKLDLNHFVSGGDLYGVEKINLNGEHNDPSIIRSKLCWDFYEDLGMSTTRSTHVAVYINGDYYGLYVSVEHIDDEFLEKNFSDDTGNLWKCLWPADLTYRGENPEDYHPYYDEDRPYELKTNEDEYDYSQLARLIGIINQTPEENFADSLESVLNIAGVLKYFAVNVLTGSWDDYWFLRNNYYLYFHPTENRFHLIPYDYDNSIGIDWFDTDWTSTDPYNFPVMDGDGRPLAERIMAQDEYRDLYTHFIEFISAQVIELPNWEERLLSLKTNIDPWVEMDAYRTFDYGFTMEDYHNSFSAEHYENLHVKRGIREFINLRMESISNLISYSQAPPVVYDYSWFPQFPSSGDSITVQASVFGSAGLHKVEIHFRETPESSPEIFQMEFSPIPNSKIVEETDRWTGIIPPIQGTQGYFKIYCEDFNGQSNLFPRHKLVEISVPEIVDNHVILNEFLASNDTTNFDEEGEFDDWLELYNIENESVNIGGMFLTDNSDNLTKWMIPIGTTLPSNGHLLFWCDNDEEQGSYHTNFKLSGGGEFLALVQPDGITVKDSLTFGDQETDISFGRISDGSDEWDFQHPTPGTSNGIESMSYSHQNTEGWNLIGLSVNTGTSSYEYNFPNSIDGTLFGFDDTYFETELLIPGKGYWLYFGENGTNIFTGDPIGNLTLALHQGWNLISSIAFPISIGNIMDTEDIIIPGSWYGFDITYVSVDSLFPGKGYWVHASLAGEIILSLSTVTNRTNINKALKHSNTLTFNNTSVYFGNKIEVDNPLSYSLPPRPPLGAKDFRFSGDSKLCKSDECLIEVMMDSSPLTIECEIKEDESWELIDESGNVLKCEGVQVLDVGGDSETYVLRKSIAPPTPSKFVLFPAYPNPFNPVTTIQFFIPDVGTIHTTSLRIYDITGTLIETLLNEKLPPGTHNVKWDGSGVSSGVYFVNMKGGDYSQTEKLMLIK